MMGVRVAFVWPTDVEDKIFELIRPHADAFRYRLASLHSSSVSFNIALSAFFTVR